MLREKAYALCLLEILQEHSDAFTAPPRGIKFWALQYLPYVELLQPLWLRDEIIESIGKNKYLK